MIDSLFPEPFLPVANESDAEAGGGRHRDSLLLFAELRSPALQTPCKVKVRNLSAGGLMAELESPLPADTAVEVEVRNIGWVPGRIAWCTAGRAGIAFDAPIDPQRARKPVGAGKRAATVRVKGG